MSITPHIVSRDKDGRAKKVSVRTTTKFGEKYDIDVTNDVIIRRSKSSGINAIVTECFISCGNGQYLGYHVCGKSLDGLCIHSAMALLELARDAGVRILIFDVSKVNISQLFIDLNRSRIVEVHSLYRSNPVAYALRCKER